MNTVRFLIALGVILCLVLSSVIALMPANTTQAQPANSDWPMFRQNLQHTGRSPYSGPARPELKWSFNTWGAVWSSPAIGANGTIYVGSHDLCKLYAINPDGSHSWNFTTEGGVWSSPAIGADGTIYVGSHDGYIYAIKPDGTQMWRFDAGAKVYSSPAIGADRTIYVGSGDYGAKLYAINHDGTEKWSFFTGDSFLSSPAIDADGIIYVGCTNDRLYAIKPDGTEKWYFTLGSGFTTEDPGVYSAPAIGADGTIYVGSRYGKLYAINPDGTEKWSTHIGPEIRSSPAIGADGTIYFGSFDHFLYALYHVNGGVKWTFHTYDEICYSSPAIDADGTIYVGSRDGYLYAVNPDGTEKWSFPTGAIDSSPAIGADGTIYIGSHDGKLYAITGYDYTLTITVGEPPSYTIPQPTSPRMGSVLLPGEGTFTYDEGEVVPLGALAEEGYHFVNWTGDVGTIADVNARITTITMNDNYTIRANFEEGPSEEGCFIATAAYGTPMAEEIEILRKFRDEYLLTNPLGQALVGLYYRASPPMAEFIDEHPSLKPIVRAGLLPAVAMSAVAVNTSPAEKIAIVGLLVLVPVAVTVWATRRRDRGREYT